MDLVIDVSGSPDVQEGIARLKSPGAEGRYRAADGFGEERH